MSMPQRFHRGDLVRVADDLGPAMAHFPGVGEQAIVLDEHYDPSTKFRDIYSLYLQNSGSSAWWDADQLTLIESNRLDLLALWEAKHESDRAQRADLDWIFDHGPEVVRDGAEMATIQTLATCLGLDKDNLSGDHGEGVVYYRHALRIIYLALPFLLNNDKSGWLEFSAKIANTGKE